MTTIHIVNAFTADGRGGNPAGVVLDADALGHDDKLRIAADTGLSETAFVSRSATSTVRLEFFTPTRQIAHCGHATIAAFGLLRALGRLGEGEHTKETIDGARRVSIRGESVWMEQRAPRFESLADDADRTARFAASLGHGVHAAPVIVDTGNRFALIEYSDTARLAAVVPDLALVHRLSDEADLIGYYLFTRDTRSHDIAATTRMFAPRYGIAEEAATGMAAGPLACLLHRDHGLGPRLRIEQGAWMAPASPSHVDVVLEMDGDRIGALFAGGRASVVRTVSGHV